MNREHLCRPGHCTDRDGDCLVLVADRIRRADAPGFRVDRWLQRRLSVMG